MVAAFKAADLADLPPLQSRSDELSKALWVLAMGRKVGEAVMTPCQISTVLRDLYGIALPRQKIQALLAKEKGTVVRRRKEGIWAYQVMQAGVDRVAAAPGSTVVLIEPEKAFSKIREIEDTLAGLRGVLSICDPYVDGRTLDFLAKCQSASGIRLLTVTVTKPGPFGRDLGAFNNEHGGVLEVRVASQKDLHDRYIVHDDGLLLLGTSLNGLGRKQSFVVALGLDLRADVLAAFNSRWQVATPI